MCELEADFTQYYHLSIIEDLGASLSIWRAAILCDQLPRNSRSNIALDESNRWGEKEHLLADVIDNIQILTWLTGGANKKTLPEPMPRPGAVQNSEAPTKNENPSLDIEELDRFLSRPREKIKQPEGG